jgi:hypothetical protein
LDATQPQRGSLVVLNPPATRDELAAYAEILDGLRSAVRWNANFNQGSEWPQLRETLAYLDRVSGSLYARFGEFVQSNDASYASELTAGKKNGVSVAYGAGTERDVLVDLLVNGTWVAGGRRTVSPGSGSTEVSFDVPAWIRPMTRGMVYVKLVPVGAPWTAKITELGFPVSVLGPDQLRGVYAPAEVAAGSSFDTNGYFEARQGMDIRADLFDASGRWLTGVQTAGTLWFESGETSNYNYKVSLTVPQLPSGSELTLYTKLLPTGAQWYSMVDEEQQKIIIE